MTTRSQPSLEPNCGSVSDFNRWAAQIELRIANLVPLSLANADTSEPLPSPREAKPLPSVEDVASSIRDAMQHWSQPDIQRLSFGHRVEALKEISEIAATAILALIRGEGE